MSFVRINFKTSYHHVSFPLKADYENSKMKFEVYDRSTWGLTQKETLKPVWYSKAKIYCNLFHCMMFMQGDHNETARSPI